MLFAKFLHFAEKKVSNHNQGPLSVPLSYF